jgi:hypothetical protein
MFFALRREIIGKMRNVKSWAGFGQDRRALTPSFIAKETHSG